MKRNILFSLLILTALFFTCTKNHEVMVVEKPTTDSINDFYIGNRDALPPVRLLNCP